MTNYHNSTIPIRPDARGLQRSTKPMKRSGKLRPVRKTRPGTDARLKQDMTWVLSKYARLRDPICIVCENANSQHGGHLWHRDMPSVEFDVRNVWGVCANCNYHHEDHPQPMHDAVLMRIGERAYADLCDLAHNSKVKLGRIELEILMSELIEKIEDQTGKKLRKRKAA